MTLLTRLEMMGKVTPCWNCPMCQLDREHRRNRLKLSKLTKSPYYSITVSLLSELLLRDNFEVRRTWWNLWWTIKYWVKGCFLLHSAIEGSTWVWLLLLKMLLQDTVTGTFLAHFFSIFFLWPSWVRGSDCGTDAETASPVREKSILHFPSC